MSAASPCMWCKLPEPSMDVHCVCHRRNCGCQPCENGRVWAYLSLGSRYWNPEDDLEILGIRTPGATTAGKETTK